ncbi:MAG: phospho-N-acetylmuramoyl-pentapeptide-transferase, partial [Solobacterium sp.]|nr:phospho-N-acetylmuramoyl-pentapeptide-transferase [Solobacterium sp.]
ALGGALAAGALILNQELALIFIGGVFVIETLCVIIQQASVRLSGKRVFPYTPIHYAFVLPKWQRGLGMGEVQTVHLFWLASLVFALLGLFVALN